MIKAKRSVGAVCIPYRLLATHHILGSTGNAFTLRRFLSVSPSSTTSDVLSFWFGFAGVPQKSQEEPWCTTRGTIPQEKKTNWYQGGPGFDAEVTHKFKVALDNSQKMLEDSIQAKIAKVILLDQFSRNIYRNTPKAFAKDPEAVQICLSMLADNEHRQVENPYHVAFLLHPLMHSEDLGVQDRSIEHFSELAEGTLSSDPALSSIKQFLHYAKLHRDVIVKYGRYPHRNKILGRESTLEELEYLKHSKGF